MERGIASTIHSRENHVLYCNSFLADEATSCTADPRQPINLGWTLMLQVTSTQLCWRRLAYHPMAISICVAHLRSWRICAMGCETGVCRPRMCTRKSSVRLRALHLAWSGLVTHRTCHKGPRDLARQFHLRAAGSRLRGTPNIRVCWNSRKHATFRSDGHAGLECATPA